MTTAKQNIGSPSFRDRQAMWAEVNFVPIKRSLPAVEKYINELKSLYVNGRIQYSAFTIPDHPVLEWCLTNARHHDGGFFANFWLCSGVREVFPHKLHDLNFFDRKIFEQGSPFMLGGRLAWILSAGGPYNRFQRGGIEAKSLGEEAATELLGCDYDHPWVFECAFAWSDFFCDVSWDSTVVIIDQQKRIIHTILATDTD